MYNNLNNDYILIILYRNNDLLSYNLECLGSQELHSRHQSIFCRIYSFACQLYSSHENYKLSIYPDMIFPYNDCLLPVVYSNVMKIAQL